ncbi:STAGA complex 65 subunit gamma-like [Dermacentor andersoni]|uniref:STAGA complex 65 subunit gamma-like n=1 Tax=Dermacentor andersoni TaxID=34620 RepID=UPI0021558546|nr:STAGA complex 65 subunit gamma-like [Dermacentor andersoni]
MAADAQHKRWGELPPLITETESGIAAIEREQITKPRPVPIQGAALYQPGARSLHYQAERSAQEYGAIDPITVHTIALIQHAKKVQSCITNLQQQDRDIKPLEAEYLPPIPEGPCIPGLTSPGNSNRLEMKSEKKCSWKPPPQLGDHATRVILRRAVTAICAQAGFDTTWNSVLEVLTDVCSDIYRRICWQLRTVVDREALTGQTGFMDAMDHALHESGLEGLQSLVQFFDERIVGYNRHMLRTCRKLHQTYHKVKLPQSCSSDDTKNIKVKEEPVSEIHFPNLEEGDENMAEAEEVPMDELHRALQNLEGVPLKDEDASRWLAQQQQQQQQQQPLAHHRKGSTASSAGHLDADEEIVIVSDSPPLSAEVSIGSLVDSVESGSLDATRLGRPPPFKKKKKT